MKIRYGLLLWFIVYAAGQCILNAEPASPPSEEIQALFLQAHQLKSESERVAVMEKIEKLVPKNPKDIEFLGDEMDGNLAPAAQKIISQVKEPSLIPALINLTEKKISTLQPLNQENFESMPKDEREKQVNQRVSLGILVETLGKNQDKRSIPVLKKLLNDETLAYQASTAISAMADEATFDELVGKIGENKNINLANINAPRLKKMLREIEDPSTSDEKKGQLINQIKGSRDPAVNQVLKELALKHPDYDVRSQAGLALVNSIMRDPSVVDTDFVIRWASQDTKNSDDDYARGWVVYAMDKTWTPRYTPVMIKLLTTSRDFSTRGETARILGKNKAVEAVPYLEKAFWTDKEPTVRSNAWGALKALTGKEYITELTESEAKKLYGDAWQSLPAHFHIRKDNK